MLLMANGYGDGVDADRLAVPTDRPLPDVTAELTALLGSPDSGERDDTAYRTLATWIDAGVYDDLLSGLGDGMVAGLRVGVGERGTDTVFRRSFSALVLAECIGRDTRRPLVPGGKVLEWGDAIATWLLRERDLRGFVPGHGWAHAIAHGADAIGMVAASPHLSTPELTVVLDVIADRLLLPVDQQLTGGEPDRLALATMKVLRRNLIPLAVLEPWIARLTQRAALPTGTDRDPFLVAGNAQAFLRALYLQLSLSQHRPPEVRANLLLVVVDALKTTNPHYLQSSAD